MKNFTGVIKPVDGPAEFFFLYIETPGDYILYVNERYLETKTEEEN